MNTDLEELGARVLVIGGGSQTTARMAARLLNVPYPILFDAERKLYAVYGFERAAGLIQQSGTVLVDRAGTVRLVERGLNPFQALDTEKLLHALGSADSR